MRRVLIISQISLGIDMRVIKNLIRPTLYILILLLPVPCSLIFPQTVIKEKIEINPRSQKVSNKLQVNLSSTLRFEMTWNQTDSPASFLVMVDCSQQNYSVSWNYSGKESITIDNAPGGYYTIQPRINLGLGEVCNVNCKVFLNDELVLDETHTVAGALYEPFAWFNIYYYKPLGTSFNISLDKYSLCYGTYTGIKINQISKCWINTSWNPSTDPISLKITSGTEYASFADMRNYDWHSGTFTKTLGDSIEIYYADLQNIRIVYDGPNFESTSKPVTMEAESNDIIQNATLTIDPKVNYYMWAFAYESKVILPNEEKWIGIFAFTDEFCSGPFYPFITFKAEIVKGEKYGYLDDPITGKTGSVLDSLFQSDGFRGINYVADAGDPKTMDTVTIRFSASDPAMPTYDLNLFIKPYPLEVTFDPKSLAPGDTANIIVKRRMTDGTLTDFPPDQLFEVGMIEGCRAGELLSGDSAGEYFKDIPPGFKFAAADTLSSDSSLIKIRVGTKLTVSGINAKITSSGTNTLKEILLSKNFNITPYIERKLNGVSNRALAISSESSSCNIFNYTYSDYAYGSAEEKKGEPKLVILQPTTNSQNEHITHQPEMPAVTCKAQLQNYSGGQVTFDWEYKVDYQLQTWSGSYTFKQTAIVAGSSVTKWTVPFNNIFRGGKVALTVKATTSEGKIYSDTLKPNSIIGDNPSPSEARSGVELSCQCKC